MATAQIQRRRFWASFIAILRSKEMIVLVVGGIILSIGEVFINRLNRPQSTPSNIKVDQSKTVYNYSTVVPAERKNVEPENVDQKVVDDKPAQQEAEQTKFVEPTKPSETQKDVPVLQLVDPNEVPESKPGDPVLQLVTSTQDDPNGLHDYYGLDLNIGGKTTTYTIGSPAILRHFKLKGSRHKGMFVITPSGLFFTGDTAVYGKSCNFYKIYATHVAVNRDGPCPGSYYSVYARISVYPCDRNVMYKIGDGNVEQADEYRFKN